ncbi:MAG: hypothetical protein JW870_09910 [Candidatus Delongbacteria bacterium]|nr:hypothetical protein [Candidatus Delongbacteria bacterium]
MIQNHKIREEIDNVDWNNYESVIDFYDRNTLYFENIVNYIKSEEIEELSNIQISYILALEKKRHYSKASKLLTQVDTLVNKLKDSPSFDKVNERFMFASGIIAQRLKKYEDSQRYFSKLVKTDPDNDLYKDWHDSNEEWLTIQKYKIVAYIGTALLIGNILLGDVTKLSRDIKLKLDIIALVMIVGGFYGHRIIKFIKGLDNKK